MEAFASLWDRPAERRVDTGDRHLFPVRVGWRSTILQLKSLRDYLEK